MHFGLAHMVDTTLHMVHMPKPAIRFVFKVLLNGLLRCIQYFTHAQTCDKVRAQCAREWTASVHTVYMPKPVISCDNVRAQSATE